MFFAGIFSQLNLKESQTRTGFDLEKFDFSSTDVKTCEKSKTLKSAKKKTQRFSKKSSVSGKRRYSFCN